MIESTSTTTFYCDGPDCEVEVTTATDGLTSPPGWLKMNGPSHLLGEFHFHSGACYDRWRINAENAASTIGRPRPS